ncbi:MAG: tRNA epoxyqueuosine(34) reductase QueG [Acidobacteriota bacterium]|nr:tRNA epoxyqueuosine(34) reductase QueG [Acidobacteriota bacterium]
MDDLTADLKQHASEEGIDLVGVASVGTVGPSPALERWIDQGMHGEMGYMERTRHVRSDPHHLLPGCRSIVAVAMSYRSSAPSSTTVPDGDERVWVSRYAWGRDYHRILKKKLVRLGRWLAARRPGCGWRACVDTAPILEREWAAMAGLGWIGKNTMLLNRHLGTELFLGLLLTDLELVADRAVPEHCGTCTACLDACPTQAFPEPHVLDAGRCVAYLTVEHRSEIPADFADKVGSMIAGCDICQEVCPWTLRSPADLHSEFAPHPDRFRPLLSELEAMTEDDYRLWRRGSPLNRISYEQFRRNLAVARRNQGARGQR